MLVLIAVLLVLLPALAVSYPLLRKARTVAPSEDEGSREAELARRWDAALDGLKNVELEEAIGNLSLEHYLSIRKQYMTEAALVLKAMELGEQREQELLDSVDAEVHRVGDGMLDEDGSGPATADPESPESEASDGPRRNEEGRGG